MAVRLVFRVELRRDIRRGGVMETATIVVQGRWANGPGWFDIRKCETREEADKSVMDCTEQYNAGLRAFGELDRGTISFRIITRRSVVTEAVLKVLQNDNFPACWQSPKAEWL